MKKVLLFSILLILSTLIIAQEKLTLQKAIKIALHRNSSLIKEKNNIEADKSDVKSAWGGLLPTLSASGGWGYTEVKTNNPAGEGLITTSGDGFDASVSSGINLFDGLANYAKISRAEKGLEAAKFDLGKLKQDIVYQTTAYYYDVLKAEELLKVREENVRYNQKFLEQIEEKNKLGSVPVADVYQQQVQAGNAEFLLIQAQNNYEYSKNTLLNYLALDVLTEYTYEKVTGVDSDMASSQYEEEFGNLNAQVKKALFQRLDYKASKLNFEGTEDYITMERSGYLPSISGNLSYSSDDDAIGDLFDKYRFSGGITLSVPIFSGWSTENRVQIAKVLSMNAKEDLSALERRIKIEVKQGYLDLLASKKQLDVANKKVISADENKKINNERYNLGSGTIIEVLQADKDFIQAQSDQIDALYDFFKNKDLLKKHLGELEVSRYEK